MILDSKGDYIVTLDSIVIPKVKQLTSVYNVIVFYELENRIIADNIEVKEDEKCTKSQVFNLTKV